MMCQQCEEKLATRHYGDLYHFCDDCNDQYLEEIAKDYLYIEVRDHPNDETR